MYLPILQGSPWRQALSGNQHLLMFILFNVTLVAFIGMIIWTLIVRRKIAAQHLRAVNIGLAVVSIACVTYAAILFKFLIGYQVGAGPSPGISVFIPQITLLTEVPLRYLEWALDVPLLVIELIAVSTLRGPRMHNLRNLGVLAAFFMVFLGYVGGWVIDNGRNSVALIGFGAAASVLFLVVYAIVIYAMRQSVRELTREAGGFLKAATGVLLVVWFVYPITYFMELLPGSGQQTVIVSIMLCTADIIAKIGFGLLVQRVARQRTDEDTAIELEELSVDYTGHEEPAA